MFKNKCLGKKFSDGITIEGRSHEIGLERKSVAHTEIGLTNPQKKSIFICSLSKNHYICRRINRTNR